MEQTTITIKRYRSPDGKPTCCTNIAEGEICRFLGARNFGTVDVCMLGQPRDLGQRTTDYCRPDKACEVRKDKEQ